MKLSNSQRDYARSRAKDLLRQQLNAAMEALGERPIAVVRPEVGDKVDTDMTATEFVTLVKSGTVAPREVNAGRYTSWNQYYNWVYVKVPAVDAKAAKAYAVWKTAADALQERHDAALTKAEDALFLAEDGQAALDLINNIKL